MSDYETWRAFYADRIIGWMTADQLRECCGRLSTADAPSPELLLFHAMHEIERQRSVISVMEQKLTRGQR